MKVFKRVFLILTCVIFGSSYVNAKIIVEKPVIQENGIYKIVIGKKSNESLEVAGSNKNNNAIVDIWDYGNVPAQQFYFEYDNSGYYKITTMHTRKSLTVKDNNIKLGTIIVQSDYTGSDGQKWIIKDSHKNGLIISPLSNPNLAITVQGTIKNGAKMVLAQRQDNDNQMLYIFNITANLQSQKNDIYKMTIGKDSSKAIEIAGSNKNNNAIVDIWDYGNVPAQKFYFEYNKDGYYKITAMHTGKSLTVKDNNIKSGASIVQSDYTGSNGQKWITRDTHKNGWVISPLSNPQLAITIQGTIRNGSRMILSQTQDNNNQMLYLFNINTNEKYQSNGTYKIVVGKSPNKSVEVAGSNKNNNAMIDIWDYGYAQAQNFNFEYKDGYYKITAKHTGKSITAKENSIKEGTEIVQSDYVGSNGQKWITRDTHKNGWIISPLSNPQLAITVQGTIKNGSKLILSNTQDNNNQMFYLYNLAEMNKDTVEAAYGKSGLMFKGNGGSYLRYYKIGKGQKHLVLNFSIHGFEDSYNKDGSALTHIADGMYNYLKKNMSEQLVNDWTIYIIPVSNPDGQYNGYTNNGPGRTTVYSWAPDHKGIDMNRCFPVGYSRAHSDRNYNGTQPLQAYEAEALRDFILKNANGSKNIVIDVHGWLNETMGDYQLGSYYRDSFEISKHIYVYGNGYLISWARSIPNTRSMLLELPWVNNYNEFTNRNYIGKFENATMNLLRNN